MNGPRTMVARVEDYLAARRHTGFDLGIAGRQLLSFARFVDQVGHEGPLTFDVAVRWAQSARGSTRLTWARRLEVLRPFARYLVQFDANTAVIPARFFGAAHRRLASISTVLELANSASAQAKRRTSVLSPNQGIGVGTSVSPEATR